MKYAWILLIVLCGCGVGEPAGSGCEILKESRGMYFVNTGAFIPPGSDIPMSEDFPIAVDNNVLIRCGEETSYCFEQSYDSSTWEEKGMIVVSGRQYICIDAPEEF